MKDFWNSIVDFFESFGRAKAASELVRQGKYDEALRLMEIDREVHP